MMKTCSCCKNELSTDMFYKNSYNRDGLAHYCKPCFNEYTKESRARNPEVKRKNNIAWRELNSEFVTEYNAKYYQENKHASRMYGAKRRAAKLNATPSWLTEDDDFMFNEIYEMAKIRTTDTGVEHHVDHIVPLQGKNVSGLHVWWNLQLLPASENISKSNKWEVS